MVNFSLLTAEIRWRVWGTPANFNGLRVLAALLHGTLVVGVSQTAALNRERHLYSTRRPSRWALAHILVLNTLECSFCKTNDAPCTCDYMLLIISLVCVIIFLSLTIIVSVCVAFIFHLIITKFSLYPLLDYALYRIVRVYYKYTSVDAPYTYTSCV